MSFTLHATFRSARRGTLATSHGSIETPFFMPIATKGSVKAVTPHELRQLRAEIILSNTYHLLLRPGMDVMKASGGLHKFMAWDGPILTDSGGYQVFSLSRLRTITDEGVTFQSHIDGAKHTLTPERSIQIQEIIGSDIMMALDDVRAHNVSKREAADAVRRTSDWAKRCKRARASRQAQLFGIVQGGLFKDLRTKSVQQMIELDFDGYAVGGLAVGEGEQSMYTMTSHVTKQLPKEKLRYFMGGARPHQIVELVKRGIDMFDCVLPTRNARHGKLYVWKQKPRALSSFGKTFYTEMNITNAKYAKDTKPVDPLCECPTCATFSRAYLRHLFVAEEPLALRLATIHNLAFYLELMKRIQKAIGPSIIQA